MCKQKTDRLLVGGGRTGPDHVIEALLPLLAILPDRMLNLVLAAALRPHLPKESK